MNMGERQFAGIRYASLGKGMGRGVVVVVVVVVV